MQSPRFRASFAATLLAFIGSVASSAATSPDPALVSAVGNSARDPAAMARDKVRHPTEELTFFGLTPTMTVVELWPGRGYWTEILGPYLAAKGHYYIAMPAHAHAEETADAKRLHAHIADQQGRFGNIHETTLGTGEFDIAPAGSADLVLTFRNLHNWMFSGYADEALAAVFKALKPGGILGIEEHRGRNDQPQDPKAKSGYVREDHAIALAQEGRLRIGRFIGNQCEPARHEGLGRRCLDSAALALPGGEGSSSIHRGRRGRQLRAQVPQAEVRSEPVAGQGIDDSSCAVVAAHFGAVVEVFLPGAYADLLGDLHRCAALSI